MLLITFLILMALPGQPQFADIRPGVSSQIINHWQPGQYLVSAAQPLPNKTSARKQNALLNPAMVEPLLLFLLGLLLFSVARRIKLKQSRIDAIGQTLKPLNIPVTENPGNPITTRQSVS